MRFSEAVRAIVSQQLLPQKGEKGRIPAVEVLIATPAVREALKNPARTAEVRKLMSDGKKQLGTQTYEQHVAELIEAGEITADTGKSALALVGASPATPASKRSSKAAAG